MSKTASSSSIVTSTSRTTAATTKAPITKNGPSTIKTPSRLSKTNSVTEGGNSKNKNGLVKTERSVNEE